jgi:nicotinic acid phosphoribosyltransferase
MAKKTEASEKTAVELSLEERYLLNTVLNRKPGDVKEMRVLFKLIEKVEFSEEEENILKDNGIVGNITVEYTSKGMEKMREYIEAFDQYIASNILKTICEKFEIELDVEEEL